MEKLNKELNATFLFSTHDDKVIGYLKRKITLNDGAVSQDEVLTEKGEGKKENG
jgi:putative ABC transport system ATP-binding protein